MDYDIVEIANKYPLSMWSVYILGFVLTYLNILNLDQWNALFVSSTISLFILAPITQLKPSIIKKIYLFPLSIIISYLLWILNFIVVHRPIPAILTQLTDFFGPVFIGILLFIIWYNLNNSIKEELIKNKKKSYYSEFITTGVTILIGIALIIPLNFIGLII